MKAKMKWHWLGLLVINTVVTATAASGQEQVETSRDELVTAISQAFSDSQPDSGAATQDATEQSTTSTTSSTTSDVVTESTESAPTAASVDEEVVSDVEPDAATVDAAEVAEDAEIAASETSAPATSDEAYPEQEANGVRQLSVEPGAVPLYPSNTPAWISAPADYSGDRHVLPVASLPTADASSADAALDEQLLATMYEYVEEQVVGEIGAADKLNDKITVDYIRKNLIDEPLGYIVELQTSTGPMYQKWVQVIVTAEQRQQLQSWHQEAMQRERLAPLGVGLAALLTGVGCFHLLVRRGGKKSAATAASSQRNRVELPVIQATPVAKKKCCKVGFAPLALMVIAPIMLGAILTKSRRVHSPIPQEGHVRAPVDVNVSSIDAPPAPQPPTVELPGS